MTGRHDYKSNLEVEKRLRELEKRLKVLEHSMRVVCVKNDSSPDIHRIFINKNKHLQRYVYKNDLYSSRYRKNIYRSRRISPRYKARVSKPPKPIDPEPFPDPKGKQQKKKMRG